MFFKKKKTFSESDRKILVDQIETIFKHLKKNNPNIPLDIEDFYSRYDESIRMDMDEKDFLFAELGNISALFEKIKNSTRRHAASAQAVPPKSVYDEIANQISSRYSKYKRITIAKNSENVDSEIEYLLGCLLSFGEKYQSAFNLLRRKLPHKKVQDQYASFDYFFNSLCMPSRRSLPKSFYDYKESTESKNDLDEIQKIGQVLLKDTFHMLMEVLKFINMIDREFQHVSNLQFYIAPDHIDFNTLKLRIKSDTDQILFDFRLSGLI